jgi:hypothetical protein
MNNTIQTILTAILIIAVTAVILGLPLMWLWNWLMPTIFYLDEITFWQALGLNALATILFKPPLNTKKD